MEGTRTDDRKLVVDVIVDYNAKSIEVMGPVKAVYELFGIKLYAMENMRSNQLLAVDSRGRGTIYNLKEEEQLRLIRED